MMIELQMVKEFHEKFEMDYNGPVRDLDNDTFYKVLFHVLEEVNEMKVAFNKGDRHGVVDGAFDGIYLLMGLMVKMGLNAEQAYEIFDRIHTANMAKVKTVDNNHKLGIMKPAGWTAPCFKEIVCDQKD